MNVIRLSLPFFCALVAYGVGLTFVMKPENFVSVSGGVYILAFVFLMAASALTGYLFTNLLDLLHRRRNPTPTEQQLVKTYSMAFTEPRGHT